MTVCITFSQTGSYGEYDPAYVTVTVECPDKVEINAVYTEHPGATVVNTDETEGYVTSYSYSSWTDNGYGLTTVINTYRQTTEASVTKEWVLDGKAEKTDAVYVKLISTVSASGGLEEHTAVITASIDSASIPAGSTARITASYNGLTLSGASTLSTKVTGLSRGRTYNIRVRAYKTVSGTKYYSAWSTKKSVKVSK